MQGLVTTRYICDVFKFPTTRIVVLRRNLKKVANCDRVLYPRTGYFPPYESPVIPSELSSVSSTTYRCINAYVRNDRRAFLKRVRRAEHWIPGFLQGRGKQPDVLLRVPLKPIDDDYNAGLYCLQKKGKVKLCGPLYELVIHPDPDGFADHDEIPDVPVRVRPMGMLVHPLTDKPVGLNFVLRPENEPVRVRVPIRHINEEKSIGLRAGGWLNTVLQAVDINVAPGVRPPLYATQDVAGLKLHGRATVGELEFEGKGEGCRTVVADETVSTIVSKC